MSKKKKNPSAKKPSVSSKKGSASASNAAAERKRRKNVATQSTIIFFVTAVALVLVFAGRWITAISSGYFDTFLQYGASIPSATSNMRGLTLTEDEAAAQLVLEKQWDLYTSSRLCDEITITAEDETLLHGYFYNENSSTTVIYLPRFAHDGTSDFLPGTWLTSQHCNLLLIDPRTHGKSGGDYCGYGVLEQRDLRAWLDWTESENQSERIVLWGEGTGANTALFAASGGLLDDTVSLIVAESPYGSLHTLASRSLFRWYTIPAVPFLNAIEYKVNHSDVGYQVSDTNLADKLEQSNCTTPVLFLESSGDDYILPQWSQEVIDAYSGDKNLISGGSTHGTVYSANAEEIHAYVEKYLS